MRAIKKSIGRAATAVAGAVVAGLGLLAVPTAARAATSTCSTPYIGFGRLCANIDPSPGYRAAFTTNANGGGLILDFNLICDNNRWFGDGGSFRTEANREYSYVFSVGNQGNCKVRLFNMRNADFWDTAYIAP
ncbi:hypothetical protein ACIBTV_28035 [Micromonospora sp. NPDC049366]|uniref:hypothetical protein n=1 Tax=Micromonospora sp. NPDC049366 TaxID=3364271 RepID=UPI0037BCC43E